MIGEPGTLVPGHITKHVFEFFGDWFYTHGLTPVARLLVITQRFGLQFLLLFTFANYTEARVVAAIPTSFVITTT